jgi:hypothetical protein
MKNTDKRENCIVKKLRSRGGETLAEMLVAVLIIALGMLMVVSLIVASNRLIAKGDAKMTSIYENMDQAEKKTSPATEQKVTVTFGQNGTDSATFDVNVHQDTDKDFTIYEKKSE